MVSGRTLAGLSLAILFLFFAGALLWWLHLDRIPPAWDDSWYLTNSLVLYDALTTGGLPGFVKAFFTVLGFKAPLIAALPALFYLLFGRDWHLAFLVNAGAMLLMFTSLYAIGRRIASRAAGLLAVIITGTMPLLYGLACWYLVEYTLTAIVAAALWLLLLTRNLEDRRWTSTLGALCGIGLLLKVSFPLYVAVPIAIAFYRSKRRVEAFALLVIPCLALALPWYAMHWRATLKNAVDAAFGPTPTLAQGTGAIFSTDAIAGYLRLVVNDGVSLYYASLALLVIAALAWWRDVETIHKLRNLSAYVVPFFVFLFAGNKDIRYAAPIYPVFALMLAIALDGLFRQRRWIPCLILIVPVVGMLATLFAWPYRGEDHRYARHSDPSVWPQDKIAELLVQRGVKTGRLLVGSDRERFNANNFELAIRQRQIPLTVESTAYESDINALFHMTDTASFFIYKEGGEPESSFFNIHAREVADHVLNSPQAEEIVLEAHEAKLPDGGTARLFRIQPPATRLTNSLPPLPELHANFGGLMELAGFSVQRTKDTIEVSFGWRCLRPINREYWCFTHIVDEQNVIIGQMDHRLAGGNPPLTEWRPGDAVAETLRHALPSTASKVRIRLGLYHVPTNERLRISLPPGSKAQVIDDGTALLIEP